VIGCGGEPAPKPPAPIGAGSMRHESMRWLPPNDDWVFAYTTTNVIDGNKGMLVLRLQRRGDDRADLIGPRHTEHLHYRQDGIFRESSGTFLLRTPAVEGVSWPGGPNATLKVAKAGVTVTVEAGTFSRCVEVADERTAPIKGVITTTFCPDVGMVLIETKGAGPGGDPPIHERVELKSHGKAVDIGAK
jgi:hypothetical protein